eukprot:2558318-Amphidinium_carterae.2
MDDTVSCPPSDTEVQNLDDEASAKLVRSYHIVAFQRSCLSLPLARKGLACTVIETRLQVGAHNNESAADACS